MTRSPAATSAVTLSAVALWIGVLGAAPARAEGSGFATYLGGAGDDVVRDVAALPDGSVIVVGRTESAEFGGRAPDSLYGSRGMGDAFLAWLSPSGALDRWVSLGGPALDEATAVAIAPGGGVVVCGTTQSGSFPNSAGDQTAFGGGSDVFVARFDASGVLVWSVLHGGSGEDEARALAVGTDGTAHVVGLTHSLDLPTTAAFQPTSGDAGGDSNRSEAFILRLAPDGSRTLASYLGGSRYDFASAVAAGPGGESLVCGSTQSLDFPVVAAWQGTPGAANSSENSFDGFVARIAADGGVDFATYLGGLSTDHLRSIARLADGRILVAGTTDGGGYPVAGGGSPTSSGREQPVTSVLAPDGSRMLFSDHGIAGGFRVTPGGTPTTSVATLLVDAASVVSLGPPHAGVPTGAWPRDVHAPLDDGTVVFAGTDDGWFRDEPTVAGGQRHPAGGTDAYVLRTPVAFPEFAVQSPGGGSNTPGLLHVFWGTAHDDPVFAGLWAALQETTDARSPGPIEVLGPLTTGTFVLDLQRSDLGPDRRFRCRVREDFRDGTSAPSATVTVFTPPLAPEGFTVASALGGAELAWTYSETGGVRPDFAVERSVAGGPWTTLPAGPRGSVFVPYVGYDLYGLTSRTDEFVTAPGETLRYRLRAFHPAATPSETPFTATFVASPWVESPEVPGTGNLHVEVRAGAVRPPHGRRRGRVRIAAIVTYANGESPDALPGHLRVAVGPPDGPATSVSLDESSRRWSRRRGTVRNTRGKRGGYEYRRVRYNPRSGRLRVVFGHDDTNAAEDPDQDTAERMVRIEIGDDVGAFTATWERSGDARLRWRAPRE